MTITDIFIIGGGSYYLGYSLGQIYNEFKRRNP